MRSSRNTSFAHYYRHHRKRSAEPDGRAFLACFAALSVLVAVSLVVSYSDRISGSTALAHSPSSDPRVMCIHWLVGDGTPVVGSNHESRCMGYGCDDPPAGVWGQNTIDWGDGSAYHMDGWNLGGNGHGDAHAYGANGVYTVNFEAAFIVRDSGGNSHMHHFYCPRSFTAAGIVAPLPPTACGDGIDNDGDGAIDGEDCGCSDITDTDEGDCFGYVGVCGAYGCQASRGETCSSCAADCGSCGRICTGFSCSVLAGPGSDACTGVGPQGCGWPPPGGTFTASRRIIAIPPGPQSITLIWSIANVKPNSCALWQKIGTGPDTLAQGGLASQSPAGGYVRPVSTSTLFTLRCDGEDGSAYAGQAEVLVYYFEGGVLKETPKP
jgi:hypothetical protein